MSQALRNLLDNVLRYAPAGAQVAVAAARHGEAVRVAVENTGEEIPAEALPRLFERFYRGEQSRSRETGGAGIGLALVKEIARAHAGEAGATSAQGVTRVWFSLSLRPSGSADPVRTPPGAGGDRGAGALSRPAEGTRCRRPYRRVTIGTCGASGGTAAPEWTAERRGRSRAWPATE